MKKISAAAWCLYDAGATAFATVVMAVVLPIYYQSVVAGGKSAAWALSSWGYASSLALFLGAVLTPVLGSWSDRRPVKKATLFVFAAVGSAASAALALVGPGDWLAALALLVTGSVALSAASVCYDSLLPSVAAPGELDKLSAIGYGLSYLGGGVLLAVDLWMISRWGLTGVRMGFLSVGLWWFALTLPFMRFVDEPPVASADGGLSAALRELRQTWNELKQYPEAFRFLLAFWLYNDGIGTIVRMAALFGAGVGLSSDSLALAMLLTQFVGVPAALAFAFSAGRFGAKRLLTGSLLWYLAICLAAPFITKNWHFWMMAVAVGLVQGGSQSISRSLFASMIPPERSGHFFGLYSLSSKFAGIVGPMLCGLTASITGKPHAAIAVIGLTFAGGLIILRFVDVERGRRRIHSDERR
ncbi:MULTISPECIES: MFS transporter [Jonquetella]|uniref:MFS transporter n=1 Tax=Jonquetella TaxID=428711 RepID=UPI0001B91097|nr:MULTISPECIES: MFS transporter [Jonquetella]EEX48132.1 transporter, major facilitator family protein [Jonquetella anthropi E3_33 E1]ERL24372.1 vacuole effluxer Atg22-like protein [Jonquetella sp. BV3C21]